MILTDREKEIIDKVVSIGKTNVSMKQVADSLGISLDYLNHKKCEIVRKNGYFTFIGFICDYLREK